MFTRVGDWEAGCILVYGMTTFVSWDSPIMYCVLVCIDDVSPWKAGGEAKIWKISSASVLDILTSSPACRPGNRNLKGMHDMPLVSSGS